MAVLTEMLAELDRLLDPDVSASVELFERAIEGARS
jgi:hypothetical protein